MSSWPGAPRVLSLPEDHPNVTHALPAELLSRPVFTDRQAMGWDLHPAFGAGWLDAHCDDLDLVHLHFGYDRVPLDRLAAWLGDLDRLKLPLVLTVHDLRNPHHVDPHVHDAQLALLLSAAAEVVTLTPGAAAEITRRSGRRARVIPHPGLLDDPAPRPDRPGHRAATVGIVVKARANVVDADAIVTATLRGVESEQAALRVDASPAVLDALPATTAAAEQGRLRLHSRDRFTDAELAAYLAGTDVAVLPYRFGSHSGWLEACRDAGTRVVAPDCGYYSEQWPQVTSYANTGRLDAGSLTAAVVTALRLPTLAPADPRERAALGEASRQEHVRLWQAALSAPGARAA